MFLWKEVFMIIHFEKMRKELARWNIERGELWVRTRKIRKNQGDMKENEAQSSLPYTNP